MASVDDRANPAAAASCGEAEGLGVVVQQLDDAQWEDHPFAKGIEQVVLLSRRDHGADATIYAYRGKPVPDDDDEPAVPLHTHATFDDISFVIAGTATIEIAGRGKLEVGRGSFVRIPAGHEHAVYGPSEDFRALNIFAPPRE